MTVDVFEKNRGAGLYIRQMCDGGHLQVRIDFCTYPLQLSDAFDFRYPCVEVRFHQAPRLHVHDQFLPGVDACLSLCEAAMRSNSSNVRWCANVAAVST